MKIDTKAIAQILGISETHIPLLVGAFLEEANSIVGKLEAASSTKNFTDITLHAHSIKGSAANLRLNEISEMAAGLEKAGKASDEGYDYVGESSRLKALITAVEL